MRRTISIIFAIVFSTGVMAQAQKQPTTASADGQIGKAILETERELDQEIFRLNELLTRHTPLFKMKLNVLPFRTLVFKGKDNGKECELNANQTDPANNCIRVEIYDFINDEYLTPTINKGGKYKYMELYFSGQSSNDPDPMKEPPRKLNRIKSKVYSNDFISQELGLTEVIDANPNGQPAHDDQIFLYTQKNGYPDRDKDETPSEKGIGKFKLANVENTRSNSIRNNFKQDYYVKYLEYFNRTLTKIFDYNDKDTNAKYKETVRMLKDSLEY